MLTSLLPGLREVRTPLISGYLWLVLIWLLVREHAVPPARATGLLRNLYDLADAAGAAGTGVAVSLVAYLAGSVLLILTEPALTWLDKSLSPSEGSLNLSARGLDAIKLAVEDALRKADSQLHGTGRALKEYERLRYHWRLQDELAKKDLSEARLDSARGLLAEVASPEEVQKAFETLSAIEEGLGRPAPPFRAAEALAQTIRRLDRAGLLAQRRSELNTRLQVLRRLSDQFEALALRDDVHELLDRLGLSLEEVNSAQDVERALQRQDLSLDEVYGSGSAKAYEGGAEREELVVQSEHGFLHLDLAWEMVEKAHSVKARLVEAGWDPARVAPLYTLENRLGNSSLSTEDADAVSGLARALRDAKVSLDEAKEALDVLEVSAEDQIPTKVVIYSLEVAGALHATGAEREETAEAAEVLRQAAKVERYVDDATSSEPAFDLALAVTGELDLIAKRLVSEEPELYSIYDRLKSEAEFRFAIFIPTTVMTVLLVVGLSPLWMTLFLPLWVLFNDGRRRQRTAGDMLADAVFLDKVQAPALDRFKAAIKEMISPPPKPPDASDGR